MCKPIEAENLVPGWICCCGVYNGLQRSNCKICDHARCGNTEGAVGSPRSVPLGVVSSLDRDFTIAMEAIERFLLTLKHEPIFDGLSLVEAMHLFKMNGGLDSTASILERIQETFKRLPMANEAQMFGLAAFMNQDQTKQ